MIAIFRHGETEYNKENRLQGWSDSPLTSKGKIQAARTAGHFANDIKGLPVHLYSSSLNRSIASAKLLMESIKVESWTTCESLRENSWGDYENNIYVDEALTATMLSDRKGDTYNFRSWDMESIGDLYERISLFLDVNRLRHDDPGTCNIFHVHCNVSRVLRGIFMRLHHSIWLNFDHKHNNYYVINNIHCKEVTT